MRYALIVLWMLLGSATSAMAQVSIGIGLPSVNIGINLPIYPNLVLVPGYPVYYAPRLDMNFFFYDGMYWVYEDDRWYASTWYNGPWRQITPEYVPLYVLRVPVAYYQNPPEYFRDWQASSPPRWGDHWGNEWAQRRRGWDRWDKHSSQRAAPLPVYQKHYSADRYPRAEQQQAIQQRNYSYQSRDTMVRQNAPERAAERPMQTRPVPSRQNQQEDRRDRQDRQDRQDREPRQQEIQRHDPPAQRVQQEAPTAPRSFTQHNGNDERQRSAPTPPRSNGPEAREQMAQQRQGAAPYEQRQQRAAQENNRQQGRSEAQEPRREQGEGRGEGRNEGRNEGRGQERNH